MLYGDVSSWNGIMNDGCLMPYGGRSKMRPNLRFNLVPTLRDSDAHFTAAGQRLHPAVADLNADGYPDVILGNHSGGLHYFQGKAFNDISVQELNLSEEPCLIYPNPARNWIQFECTQASIVSVHIYSSTGEHVAQLAPNKRTSLELAPGLYVAVFQNKDGGLHRQKLIIL
jgi:hypothetical protein